MDGVHLGRRGGHRRGDRRQEGHQHRVRGADRHQGADHRHLHRHHEVGCNHRFDYHLVHHFDSHLGDGLHQEEAELACPKPSAAGLEVGESAYQRAT